MEMENYLSLLVAVHRVLSCRNAQCENLFLLANGANAQKTPYQRQIQSIILSNKYSRICNRLSPRIKVAAQQENLFFLANGAVAQKTPYQRLIQSISMHA